MRAHNEGNAQRIHIIGVMGLMGSLAMAGGQQATDAARATNIADNLEKAASAMMMFYADQADAINTSGVTAENLAKGANVYLKAEAALAAESTNPNTYFVAVITTNKAINLQPTHKRVSS